MAKYIVLINFTEKGLAHIEDSPKRASAFRKTVESKGGRIETILWTTGPYDGLAVLDVPDEDTAVALTLGLNQTGNVRTSTLRAYDADGFKAMLGKK